MTPAAAKKQWLRLAGGLFALLAVVGVAAAQGSGAGPPNAPLPARRKVRKKKPPPVRMEVVVGQGNRIRLGKWAPVRVTLDNDAEAMEGFLEVSSRNGRTQMAVSLPRGAHKRYTLYVRLYDNEYQDPLELRVALRKGRRVIVKRKISPKLHGAGGRMVVACTGEGSGLKYLDGLDLIPARRSAAAASGRLFVPRSDLKIRIVASSPADMPRWWAGLEPADAVVISGTAWAQLDGDQRRALRTWVHAGGRAILTAEDSTEWRDAEGAALAPVLPLSVRPRGRLEFPGELGGRVYAPATALVTVAAQARPLAAGESFPSADEALFVHARAVRGDVLWLGFNPFRQAFRDWDGNEDFWRAALRWPKPAATMEPLHRLRRVAEIVRTLPKLPAPPRLGIFLFGAGYVLFFGPINILLLRRFRRTVRAWLCMPFLALAMTGIVLIVGQFTAKARTVLSSVCVLQTEAGARTAWRQELMGLFSPINRRFEVIATDPATEFQRFNTDSGGLIRPPTSGEQAAGTAAGLFTATEPQHPPWPAEEDSAGEAAPVTRWPRQALGIYSTLFLYGQQPLDLGGGVRVRLRSDGSGAVANDTPYRLTDAYLRRGDRRAPLGELAPGARTTFTAEDWRPYKHQRLSRAEVQALPRENRLFLYDLNNLDQAAVSRLIAPSAQSGPWLVARVAEAPPAIEMEGQPFNNRATLLLARAAVERQP